MAIIEAIHIENYGVLKDLALGHAFDEKPLTPLTTVIGKKGAGKSTLFDAFGFLADCLKFGVEVACDMRGRGGFERIRSQESNDPIMFFILFRQSKNTELIAYQLFIDTDKKDRPKVALELLSQLLFNQSDTKYFMILHNGKGLVSKDFIYEKKFDENFKGFDMDTYYKFLVSNNLESESADEIELDENSKLGIATYGAMKDHPRISAFREFMEGWHLSYFHPDSARTLPETGAHKRLNSKGDNLSNVVQYMQRDHPKLFKRILKNIAKKIPGINTIEPKETLDKRIVLCFNDKGFNDPFQVSQMSDGTLKLFAYLLLLNDPTPPPFICIEEPENGLYHKLLETLAHEFRTHATGKKNSSQLFITTHQPHFIDGLSPEEVWVLEKGKDGFAKITRASDIPTVRDMVGKGLPLGSLWYSDYLDARQPMHFEILAEDASGKIALEFIMGKIVGPNGQDHSFKIISYKGIGHLPKNLIGKTNPWARILLDRLPVILAGYGKSLQYGGACVVVVVDLDDKNCIDFKQELVEPLHRCDPKPETLFRIAIEEGEAWLLGDQNAVVSAYPNALPEILTEYIQDSISGTWEILADAIHPGGSTELTDLGFPHTGIAKCEWATKITPHMNIQHFSKVLRSI